MDILTRIRISSESWPKPTPWNLLHYLAFHLQRPDQNDDIGQIEIYWDSCTEWEEEGYISAQALIHSYRLAPDDAMKELARYIKERIGSVSIGLIPEATKGLVVEMTYSVLDPKEEQKIDIRFGEMSMNDEGKER